jgi:hypothetical protein
MDPVIVGLSGIDCNGNIHLYESDQPLSVDDWRTNDMSVSIDNLIFPLAYWSRFQMCTRENLKELKEMIG